MSEDCLHLNVLTPAASQRDRLPVLVWFHGGGLDILSGNMARYNTPDLAQAGAVVVTISHRLNAFGYLAHPWLNAESPHKSSGHYGNLDLIAALQWVQENIAAFGGDPQRVTIFGQSGGGRKVNFMMASPIVPSGLFQRAISMSSSINTIAKEQAEKNGAALIEALGVKSLAELRAKPWREIVAAAAKTRFSGQLVEDGWALTEPVTQSFADGDQKDVPFMIGMVLTEDAGHFNVPVRLLPTIKQRRSPVYAYAFTAVPAGWRKDGVTGWHAIDMAYLFGSAKENFENAKPEYFRAYAQTQGAKNKDPGLTTADLKFAQRFQQIWVQFAATANPSLPRVLDWPAYRAETDRYVELDVPLAVKSGYSKLQHKPAPGARE
jgi:para-nitrobenzyl esterase